MLEGPAAPGRAQGAGRPHLVTDLIGSAREDALAVGRLVIEGVQVPAVAKSAMANASVLASAVVDAVKASRGAANLNDIAQLRELAVAFFTHAQTCETAFHTIVAPLNVAADALFDIALKHEMRTDARRLDEQTKGVATALVAAVTPDRMRASAAESHRGVPVSSIACRFEIVAEGKAQALTGRRFADIVEEVAYWVQSQPGSTLRVFGLGDLQWVPEARRFVAIDPNARAT